MEIYVFCAVSLIWGAVTIIQSFLHRAERRSLYDRIMSKDLGEYNRLREQKGRAHTAPPSAHQRALRHFRGWEEDK